ncbi:MAG: 5'-methylthioadenosine phosphorylase, partial [Armatimonadota bacterium]
MHESGTYLNLNGPRYETPAEVRLFGQWGADVVGMTAGSEAILMKEAGVPYACVAVVTNLGTGLSSTPLSHKEVG